MQGDPVTSYHLPQCCSMVARRLHVGGLVQHFFLFSALSFCTGQQGASVAT